MLFSNIPGFIDVNQTVDFFCVTKCLQVMVTSIYVVKTAIFSVECHFSKILNGSKKGLKSPGQFLIGVLGLLAITDLS